jgi:hypothetical protein
MGLSPEQAVPSIHRPAGLQVLGTFSTQSTLAGSQSTQLPATQAPAGQSAAALHAVTAQPASASQGEGSSAQTALAVSVISVAGQDAVGPSKT